MADEIRATPQNATLGAIARALQGVNEFAAQPFGYANPPGAVLSELAGVPALQRTLERLSYGAPLTSGAGGLGGTTRPLEDTTDVMLNFAPLAAIAGRGALKGATAVARSAPAQAIDRAVRAGYERGLIPAPGMVIKQPGGNWLAGSVEQAVGPMKQTVREPEFMRRIAQDEVWGLAQEGMLETTHNQNVRAEAINRWLDTKLSKYIRNEMGTPEDPVRLQADEWAVKKQQLLAAKDRQIAKAVADMEKARAARGFTPEQMTQSQADIRKLRNEREYIEAQTGLHFTPDDIPQVNEALRSAREKGGFSRHGSAKSPAAADWETLADDALLAGRDVAGAYTHIPQAVERNPWLLKVPPETPVHDLSSVSTAEELGFDHLIDELRGAMNPASELPERLRLNPKDIDKLTVPRAVKLVDEINAWRASRKAEANRAIAGNAATQVFKEYPEAGLKWVELKVPEMPEGWAAPERYQIVKPKPSAETYAIMDRETGKYITTGLQSEEQAVKHLHDTINREAVADALKYEGEMLEHCVGSYCPDVTSGKSRIFSLRDEEGRPKVTIEMQPQPFESFWRNLSAEEQQLVRKNAPGWASDEELLQALKNILPEKSSMPPDIAQIKTRKNARAIGPDVEYVKDFLNSQPFGEVKDLPGSLLDLRDAEALRNALPDIAPTNNLRDAQALFQDFMNNNPNTPRFVTRQELRELLAQPPAEGYADGGAVRRQLRPGEGLPDPTLLNMRLYADTVSREMFPSERDNAKRDAARHMIASAIAAQKTSPSIAEMLGKAYEFSEAPFRTAGHWLGLSAPRADYPTDIHNNALGVELGRATAGRSLQEMLDAAERAVQSGTPTRQPGRVSLEPDSDVRYADGGAVDAQSLYAKYGLGGEIQRFDKGGAAFGVFPHLKGRRTTQDPEAAKNVPIDVARGFISGTLGAPGDIESIVRMIPGLSKETILPTSEEIERNLPFRSNAPVSKAATGAGQLAGGFYTGPGSGLRIAAAVPKAIVKGARDFAEAAGQSVSPLTVWHGSPHKFEKFDASKIGTGEGAQAYGHGLYFAETPDVAKAYQPRSMQYEEKLLKKYNQAQARRDYPTMEILEDAMLHKTPDEIVNRFTGAESGYTPQHERAAKEFAAWYQKNPPEVGALYKVDIPDEKIAQMLDWDKPISQQPAGVRTLLGSYAPGDFKVSPIVTDLKLTAENDARLAKNFNMVNRFIDKYAANPTDKKVRDQLNYYFKDYPFDQSQFKTPLESLEAQWPMPTGEAFKKAQHELGAGVLEEQLRKADVPGVKYLDQGSRGTGEGTRNFVVFPGEEQSLTILERQRKGGAVKYAEGGAVQYDPEEISRIAARVTGERGYADGGAVDSTAPAAPAQPDNTAPLTQDSVNRLYNEYLGRGAEQGIYDQWKNVGGNEQNLRDALAASDEYKSRLGVVNLYNTALGRNPEEAGLNYWAGRFGTEIDPTETHQFLSSAQGADVGPAQQYAAAHPLPVAPVDSGGGSSGFNKGLSDLASAYSTAAFFIPGFQAIPIIDLGLRAISAGNTIKKIGKWLGFEEGGIVDSDAVGADQAGVNRMVALEQGGPTYSAGGAVQYDPAAIDALASRVKEEFYG